MWLLWKMRWVFVPILPLGTGLFVWYRERNHLYHSLCTQRLECLGLVINEAGLTSCSETSSSMWKPPTDWLVEGRKIIFNPVLVVGTKRSTVQNSFICLRWRIFIFLIKNLFNRITTLHSFSWLGFRSTMCWVTLCFSTNPFTTGYFCVIWELFPLSRCCSKGPARWR